MKKILIALWALTCAGFVLTSTVSAETADGYKSYVKMGKFDDVLFDLNNAIVDRGLVIDYVGHLQQMLTRTSETVGSVTPGGSKTPYTQAQFLQFCSAKLTHEVISANPLNIAICPYVVFIYELKTDPGKIHVGFRRPIGGPSKLTRKAVAKVEALLEEIAEEATK